MPADIDPNSWPFEAHIDNGDGGYEYCQYARGNEDGTVTVCEFCPPIGFAERTFPKDRVKLGERPCEKAQKWYDLYEHVYGSRK